jgi:hypothetical protein
VLGVLELGEKKQGRKAPYRLAEPNPAQEQAALAAMTSRPDPAAQQPAGDPWAAQQPQQQGPPPGWGQQQPAAQPQPGWGPPPQQQGPPPGWGQQPAAQQQLPEPAQPATAPGPWDSPAGGSTQRAPWE